MTAPSLEFERLLAAHGEADVEYEAAQKKWLTTRALVYRAGRRKQMSDADLIDCVVQARQKARAAREAEWQEQLRQGRAAFGVTPGEPFTPGQYRRARGVLQPSKEMEVADGE